MAFVGAAGCDGTGGLALRCGGFAMVAKAAVLAALSVALGWCCYELGKSRAEVKFVEKEVEVVRYVEKKRAEIYARPNAGRDALLELMRGGKL